MYPTAGAWLQLILIGTGIFVLVTFCSVRDREPAPLPDDPRVNFYPIPPLRKSVDPSQLDRSTAPTVAPRADPR